ncbi:purine and uridine phosphorylase, partial [Ascobolus immersus RN42]
MSPEKPEKEDYTVAWICALPHERAVAEEILDEEHSDIDFPLCDGDTNSYTHGRIQKHNIVIASLPQGTPGSISAATAYLNLIRSYPRIRFGLMVGIGAGVPGGPCDVRLGDVVVSKPGASHGEPVGGVWQYDFGTEYTEEFITKGVLNKPPLVLRNALTRMESLHLRKGSQIANYISVMLHDNTIMEKPFARPPAEDDLLFKEGYSHDSDSKGYSDCSKCKRDQTVEPLEARNGKPKIHYGLIASGDKVVRKAAFRQWLRKKNPEVLCIEMEAAGLMDTFPCLIIRGICDYADDHKNDKWQNYAAAAAAAYAKELLENTFKQWTSPEALPAEAVNNGTTTLFCPGLPGAGKSIMSSIVIDHLRNVTVKSDNQHKVVFLYCDYQRKEEQTVEQLFSCLLRQLCSGHSSGIPKPLERLYQRYTKSHAKRNRPPVKEVISVVRNLIQEQGLVYLIIDALDELDEATRRRFVGNLQSLQSELNEAEVVAGKLRLLVTSRSIADISDEFEGCLQLEIRASDTDISKYLSTNMPLQLSKCALRSTDLQELIRRKICEVADGRFILAKHYLKSLADKMTARDIKEALQSFSKVSTDDDNLSRMSEDTINRIEELPIGKQMWAQRVIAWVFYAQRPFQSTMLRDALADVYEYSDSDRDDDVDLMSIFDCLPDLDEVVSLCAGVVVLNQKGNIVQFAHLTMKQHLEDKRFQPKWLRAAQLQIAKTCL